jgi:hypothetical protein
LASAEHLNEAISAAKAARSWFVPDSAAMVTAYEHLEQINPVHLEDLRQAARGEIMYGGVPDLARYVTDAERRAQVAIALLRSEVSYTLP